MLTPLCSIGSLVVRTRVKRTQLRVRREIEADIFRQHRLLKSLGEQSIDVARLHGFGQCVVDQLLELRIALAHHERVVQVHALISSGAGSCHPQSDATSPRLERFDRSQRSAMLWPICSMQSRHCMHFYRATDQTKNFSAKTESAIGRLYYEQLSK